MDVVMRSGKCCPAPGKPCGPRLLRRPAHQQVTEDIEVLRRFAARKCRCNLDRIIVETDSPYLSPVPYRGKPNEPAYLIKTLETLAQVRGVTAGEMARITSDNFFRLFSKVPRPARFAAAA